MYVLAGGLRLLIVGGDFLSLFVFPVADWGRFLSLMHRFSSSMSRRINVIHSCPTMSGKHESLTFRDEDISLPISSTSRWEVIDIYTSGEVVHTSNMMRVACHVDVLQGQGLMCELLCNNLESGDTKNRGPSGDPFPGWCPVLCWWNTHWWPAGTFQSPLGIIIFT